MTDKAKIKATEEDGQGLNKSDIPKRNVSRCIRGIVLFMYLT